MTAPEIPYQPRSTQEYKSEIRRYYVIFLIATALSTSTMLFFLLLIMPLMKERFKDFKTTLPSITEWVLNIADYCHGGWWIAALPVVLLIPYAAARFVADQKSASKKVVVAMLYFFCFYSLPCALFLFLMMLSHIPPLG